MRGNLCGTAAFYDIALPFLPYPKAIRTGHIVAALAFYTLHQHHAVIKRDSQHEQRDYPDKELFHLTSPFQSLAGADAIIGLHPAELHLEHFAKALDFRCYL